MTLTLDFSEAPQGLTASDFSALKAADGTTSLGGTFSDPQVGSSNLRYTVIWTPPAATDLTQVRLNIGSGTFTDAAGNANTSAASVNISVDTSAPTVSTVVLEGHDAGGNISDLNSITFTRDTTATQAAQVSVGLKAVASSDSGTIGDALTNVTTPILTGTAEAYAKVSVRIGTSTSGAWSATGDAIYTTWADADGKWSIQVGKTAIEAAANGVTQTVAGTPAALDGNATDGKVYAPRITVTDPAGNTSSEFTGATFTVDTQAPAGTTASLTVASDTGTTGDHTTNLANPVLGGSAQAGARLELTLTVGSGTNATTSTYTTVVDSSGKWEIALRDNLTSGTYTPTIKVTDPAGNASTSTYAFTVDRDAPNPATVGTDRVNLFLQGGNLPVEFGNSNSAVNYTASGGQTVFSLAFNENADRSKTLLTSDFSITNSAGTVVTPTAISWGASGNSLSVTYGGGALSGVLGLKYNGSNLVDLQGSQLRYKDIWLAVFCASGGGHHQKHAAPGTGVRDFRVLRRGGGVGRARALPLPIELGVFLLALAFGLWQIQDVKKAREATRRQRAQAQAHAEGRPSGLSEDQAAARPGESAGGTDGRTDGGRDGGGEGVTADHQAGERTDSKASGISERR